MIFKKLYPVSLKKGDTDRQTDRPTWGIKE